MANVEESRLERGSAASCSDGVNVGSLFNGRNAAILLIGCCGLLSNEILMSVFQTF